jgi:hypothetical protein
MHQWNHLDREIYPRAIDWLPPSLPRRLKGYQGIASTTPQNQASRRLTNLDHSCQCMWHVVEVDSLCGHHKYRGWRVEEVLHTGYNMDQHVKVDSYRDRNLVELQVHKSEHRRKLHFLIVRKENVGMPSSSATSIVEDGILSATTQVTAGRLSWLDIYQTYL